MNKNEIISSIKQYCKANKLTYVDDVTVGQNILVLVLGTDSANKLNECLTNLELEHTTPTVVSDAIGSYIKMH